MFHVCIYEGWDFVKVFSLLALQFSVPKCYSFIASWWQYNISTILEPTIINKKNKNYVWTVDFRGAIYSSFDNKILYTVIKMFQ